MSIVNGDMVEALVDHCDELLEAIKGDYKSWSDLSNRYDGDTESRRAIRDDMIAEFNSNLHYFSGKKYIKIVAKNTVWGFVVACTNDKKFQFGDLLKPAGWAAPARNFSRGNIFGLDAKRIRWSGCQ